LFPSRPRTLAPAASLPIAGPGIRSLSRVGKPRSPRVEPVLYLLGRVSIEAAPQCISGRTSYLRVRLAFHPYPQLIRPFCNTDRFGRPARITAPSAWPWVAHPVSGLFPATIRPIRTRLRCGSGCRPLSLATGKELAGPFYKKYAVTPTRRRRAPTDRERGVSGSISSPSPGCFSPFPRGTGALSVAPCI
jgi:hypothetical protein